MISVCIATYNGEIYIQEQIESILQQLGPDDEIILADDGSTDSTVEKVKAMGDPRIKILTSNSNLGYSKNFERAFTASSGDVIFASDQDDIWLPGKVKTTTEFLVHFDMVVSDAIVVDKDLNILAKSHFFQNGTRKGFVTNFLRTRYIGACMAFHRRLLMKALPFPEKNRYCAYDYWLAVIGELFFSVKLLEEPLILYRRHENNASTGGQGKSHNSLIDKLMIRFYTLFSLILRAVK